jgi:hypothetical protein
VKIAIIGNCQADPLRHMLLFANPKFKIEPLNVNNLKEEDKQFQVFLGLSQYDLIISQVLSREFHALSSENIKSHFSNTILIPNIFFLGWHPDMTYLGDGKRRVFGASEDLHDLVCVLIAKEIWNKSINLESYEIEDLYDNTFNQFMKLHDSFTNSKEILKKRFNSSDISFEIFEKQVGFDQPFMFTHNHPMNRAFLGIVKQILEKVAIKSRLEDQELIDYSPNPLANRVAWSPLHPAINYSSEVFRNRLYYVGKGRFIDNAEFIRSEVNLLTKLETIPSLRRPDIAKETTDTLRESIKQWKI